MRLPYQIAVLSVLNLLRVTFGDVVAFEFQCQRQQMQDDAEHHENSDVG